MSVRHWNSYSERQHLTFLVQATQDSFKAAYCVSEDEAEESNGHVIENRIIHHDDDNATISQIRRCRSTVLTTLRTF